VVDLTVVMPIYNEEGAISKVLRQWTKTLQFLEIDYQIVAYNDGSKDETLSVIKKVAQNNPRIIVIDKPNSGHGPTILRGYIDHLDSPWIFQVDSDGELEPGQFNVLWANRMAYDFLIGRRIQRRSPWPRKLTTWISRCLVWLLYGRSVFDVNCPYRLFRTSKLREHLQRIPSDTFAPNLIISGLASRLKLRVFQMDIVHSERKTGEVSIKKWKLLKAALRSCKQTVIFRGRV
jgi:glycosyltransferase involved in cell wall biosynthesis